MDCIVRGVTKSWTQLSDFHFHFFQALFSNFSLWISNINAWILNSSRTHGLLYIPCPGLPLQDHFPFAFHLYPLFLKFHVQETEGIVCLSADLLLHLWLSWHVDCCIGINTSLFLDMWLISSTRSLVRQEPYLFLHIPKISGNVKNIVMYGKICWENGMIRELIIPYSIS